MPGEPITLPAELLVELRETAVACGCRCDVEISAVLSGPPTADLIPVHVFLDHDSLCPLWLASRATTN